MSLWNILREILYYTPTLSLQYVEIRDSYSSQEYYRNKKKMRERDREYNTEMVMAQAPL